jgi:hypothetical protein
MSQFLPRIPRSPIPDDRLRFLARRRHDLGPRATYELLRELRDGNDMRARLEKYAELDQAIVAAVGARDLSQAARAVR